jgi:isoleucyl-tRNA synthetase
MGTRGNPPYKMVLTHGFVVDGEGRKMSKSVGNVIPPQQVIDRYGAEILRLWVAAEDYTDDIRISEEILKQLAEAYRRIRNTMRFMLGNLYDFDPAKDAVDVGAMGELDRLMLHRLEELTARLKKAYQEFAFHVVYHGLHNFCAVDLSGFYLDVLKDRLYTSAAASPERRAAQTVLHRIATSLVRLMAPILSFTAEEVWDFLPGAKQQAASVHLMGFPQGRPQLSDPDLAARWDRLLSVRGAVNKALDLARKDKVVGNSLEASLTLTAPADLLDFLKANQAAVQEITMVSELTLAGEVAAPTLVAEDPAGLMVGISASAHAKCPRCGRRAADIGADGAHPELCGRCARAVGQG